MANIVAIVGRPNVGKSTLFNRLIEERKAIMDDQSGVTRDRQYGNAEWCGNYFTVVDTGGYVTGSDDEFEKQIRQQVEIVLDEADVVLFMVDVQTGVTPLDKDFARFIQRVNKPVYLVANKVDSGEKDIYAAEFYELGIPNMFTISSQNGSGTGELLDQIVTHFQKRDIKNPYEGLPRIAVLGRPNVGKSSFLNSLLGTERSIVSDQAGTTRDSTDTLYKAYGKEFVLTDTAGLRKKAKVKDQIEFYSTMRTIRALEDSDVCVIMVDAESGVESQDLKIIGLADDRAKGIVLMVNKWDTIEKDSKTADTFKKSIYEICSPMTYFPVIFTSVTEKQRIFQSIEKAIEVSENRKMRISTSELNDYLLPEIERNPPPALKGKYIKIKYITQLPAEYPLFAFYCNLPQYIKDPYKRFLERKIREKYKFEGAPMRIIFRKK